MDVVALIEPTDLMCVAVEFAAVVPDVPFAGIA